MDFLAFRHDPPPFTWDEEVWSRVFRDMTGESKLYVFGLCVKVTADKKRRLQHARFEAVEFSQHVISFDAWWMRQSTSERLAYRRRYEAAERTDRDGPYHRPGGYTPLGTFVQEHDGRENAAWVISSANMTGANMFGVGPDGTQRTADAAQRATEAMSARTDRAAAGGNSSETARATARQAAQTTQAAAELENALPTNLAIGRWNLRTKQRRQGHAEVHVAVSRGKYDTVRRYIVNGRKGGYVITGPTGCGKSTVALLGLFRGPKKTTLIVEPTQANAANIYHEFTNVLPNMVENGIIQGPVPDTRFVAPTVSRPPFTQLMITTTTQLLEYFYWKGELPKVDYLVLDEFHLPIPSMVETVELLRTFDVIDKYILVSATAVGYAVHAQLPPAVTHIYGNLPLGRFPAAMERSDLDPRRWAQVGDGTVSVATPSIAMARRLYNQYVDWGLRTYLITRDTKVSYYMRVATDYRPNTNFVIEPGVEAGITIGMAVFVSMGASMAIRYDGKVVLEDIQPLSPNDAIQRGGRAGRIKPTLYVTPQPYRGEPVASAADYFRAQAIIKMIAMGASVGSMDVQAVLEQFPKLATLTQPSAAKAIESGGDPFLAVYRTAPDGRVYRECGGDGEGFSMLAERELFLYHYKKGYFVAPIADFSDLRSVPDAFVLRQKQFDAATAMVDAIPGLSAKYQLEDLVAMVVAKFDVYVGDFFDRMKKIFPASQAHEYNMGVSTPPEIFDFVRESPAIVKLFDYLKTQPLSVRYERIVGGDGRVANAKHSFYLGEKSLHFQIPPQFMHGSSVDVPKLSKGVQDQLQGLLAIEILLQGAPSRCVDLEGYRDRVAPEHVWFKNKVL